MGTGNYLDPDASTAKSLTLVALILQAVFFFIGIAAVTYFFLFFAAVSSITSINGATTTSIGSGFVFAPVAGFFSVIFGFAFIVSIVWIVLDYVLVYRNLSSPQSVANARTPSIVLGIIQLLFGGFIPGILLIIAYVKIGDSMRRRWQIY